MLKLFKAHSTKADLVYRTLRDAIIANQLAPGTRLIVREIATQLSVSDIPVREALSRLEATGLIQTKPYAGATVTTPSPEWLEEAFVIRAALESMAAATSVPHLRETDLEELRELHAAMKETARRGETVEYARLNREFHDSVVVGSPYRVLLRMLDDVQVRSEYGRAIFGLAPAAMARSCREHRALLAAVEGRDAELVARLSREHRLRAAEDLVAAIRARADAEPAPARRTKRRT